MMELSKRLQTIYDLTPRGVVADVGSDHGKLIISLYDNQVIAKGYAIENKRGPFARLIEALSTDKERKGITPLLSDGISELPQDVDVVIVAGMGGYNIINILKNHVDKLNNVTHIIVDPHNAIKEVREEITALGYHINQEKIIYEEDVYYEIIDFIKGETPLLNDLDFEFGPLLRKEKNAVFLAKYHDEINKINLLLDNPQLPTKRKKELEDRKKEIEKVL